MSAWRLPSTRRVLAKAEAFSANWLVAYGLILALQIRVIWNVWRYKDLTSGDTSSYFLDATSWAHGLHDDIVWSPLYTDFFGTVDAVVKPVYAALMVHRIGIIIVATLLVLALMRALLGPVIALLITVWWVVLPPNFNVEYEVHLFGALPIIVAALVVARSPGRTALGVSLAVLAGAAVLVRNELLIATVILGLAIFIKELRGRRGASPPPRRIYLRAYGIPLAIMCLIVAGSYWRSFDQGHNAVESFTAKQDLNMCQVYATNYQQRYPNRFPGNPFTECSTLMRHDFGQPMPSLLQASKANPRAVAAMIGWNAILLPSGLQVALFDATMTGNDPDYFPVNEHQSYALVLSVIALALLIAGSLAIARDRGFWRERWLPTHAWAVIVLGALGVTTLVVALTQRPRPEYMYGLTVGLLALIGVCALALLRRVNGVRPLALGALVLPLVLIVMLPSFYDNGTRPVRSGVERLSVAQAVLQRPGSVLIAAEYNFELCAYLSLTYAHHCESPSWPSLQAELDRGEPIQRVLDQAKATAIYAESNLLDDPSMAKLVSAPERYGWRQVAGGTGETGTWSVLVRST